MNATKKINVNFSSLVGLKAELLRKQTEVNEAKLRAEIINSIPKLKKKSKKPKKDTDKDKDSQNVTDVDEINAHKKSKLVLETKTRLYDRLKKSKHNNDNFLVDFENKPDEPDDERPPSDDEVDDSTAFDDDDDWIEYQDCFGRTRKCLREDLILMQEKDDLIKQKIMNKAKDSPNSTETTEQSPVIEEKEPEIEIMRRKWEEQSQKLADKANIHYQDILFDEARAHGVGYYAFSQDEEERIKQQENLINLRKDTERKQKEMKELKEMRDKMEQNRLKAARIRQRIRAGLPAEPTEEELSQNNIEPAQIDDSKMTNSNDANSAEDNSVADVDDNAREEGQRDEAISRKKKLVALGELLGKATNWHEMSQEEWIDKRRKIRVTEFGPVYDNFQSAGYLDFENSNLQLTVNENETESGHSKTQSATRSEDFSPNVKSSINYTEMNAENECNVRGTNETEAHSEMHTFYGTTSDSIIISENSHDSPEIPNKVPAGSTEQNESTVGRNINEESIAAGLKYLREKFEGRSP